MLLVYGDAVHTAVVVVAVVVYLLLSLLMELLKFQPLNLLDIALIVLLFKSY